MNEVQLEVAKAYPNDSGRGIARLDPDTLLHLKLSPGDIIEIEGAETTAAKVWRADRQDWNTDTIRIDGFTRQNAEVGIGERVKIRKADAEKADTLVLAPPEEASVQFGSDAAGMVKRQILKRPVVARDIVPVMSSTNHPFMRSPGQAIPLIAVETEPEGVCLVTEDTDVELREEPISGFERTGGGITYEDIGGLENEIQRVREMVELPMKHPQIFQKLGIEPPQGVLLHGPPGTGKTLLAKAVANETSASFFSIAGPEIISKYYGESEQQLREIFEDAKDDSPSIIFIDELDSIAPKREDVTGEVERRVVAQLLTMMDGLEGRGQVIVIAATNRVDAVDPALRRPGRFDREIEIGVPDEIGREEILKIHTRGMPLSDDVNLSTLADDTHGFVGADIESLSKEAAMRALRRYLPEIDLDEEDIPPSLIDRMIVKREDFKGALSEVEPSAMREVLVELPKITWDDVGGLTEAKNNVKESVEWPLNQPEKFTRMGVEPPAGVLLYGPPGTGKTLMAKAVANETNANFISVRGPQLLSKWVGESEKAIRQTFRKARQVAPTVIFFDELDSLAPGRGQTGGNNVSERVVNQLLTELDGLEEMEEVMVIAATNRPDIIDPALIRSGRFDRLVQVGQPGIEGREQILKIHTQDTPLAADVSLRELAERADGYVGSDLANIAREAAIEALRDDEDADDVGMAHFRAAMENVRPTITDDLMEYYDQVEDQFKGSQGPNVNSRQGSEHIGFQ
ncbi:MULTISPECIES: CDC48 family AAA ATPase [Halobacterium]|uniref:Protein CdcH n=7 Tax=Halobacterium salinarum TaxID=2242 RepID=CDCH_HALSA|nr:MULTISPECIES: CDC48 family AAA ATPase [Halobacterium]Q9HPF0.1 RecName: Full=Protein CdcH [Halobacterium salinarum NRC-1]AAG19919.1 cell division cycle protein [Halobacterium salinarum NRC-1]MBB6088924.1 transitional endoplasmic reticulum ATPase [Halobacterium salinarum]MCF2164859.1 CDC48 family AAA ATPase [Halobacterium salinarum]MCF2168516.1 CDC48 family AAA ATPase [Halobacterium salinarum]MCF2207436.1 CDC48 family AAA ATPase [Halobacterium salinarum]